MLLKALTLITLLGLFVIKYLAKIFLLAQRGVSAAEDGG